MTTALISREYNGNVFHFREDGYFNMTKAAKAFGKKVERFWETVDAIPYVDELSQITGKPRNELVQAKRGNGGGTGHTPSSPSSTPVGSTSSSPCSATWSSTTSSTRRPSWSSQSQLSRCLGSLKREEDVARLRDELRVHLGIHFNEEFVAEITKEIQ